VGYHEAETSITSSGATTPSLLELDLEVYKYHWFARASQQFPLFPPSGPALSTILATMLTIEWPEDNKTESALRRIGASVLEYPLPLHLTAQRILLGEWVKAHPELVAAGAAAVIGAALAPVLVPLVLSSVGFGAGGVAAGSLAAGMHAAIGNVAAGSLFALAQSVGAGAALPLTGYLVSAGLSAALAAKIAQWLKTQLADGKLRKCIRDVSNSIQLHRAVLEISVNIVVGGSLQSFARFFASMAQRNRRIRAE
jgi:hypothetical protein